jgi:hypothetical protein
MADDGYCEPADVRRVLQESEFSGAHAEDPRIVGQAITSQSEATREFCERHWYDPDAPADAFVATEPLSAQEIRVDVPSSPHPQDRQRFVHERVRYPVTTAGPYSKVRLPHVAVSSLSALYVRERGGGVTDWVADSEHVEGRGEDFYVSTPTDGGKAGRSYLYIRAGALPPVTNFQDLLTLEYQYGRPEIPDSVRRATAFLAAHELVIDDEAVAGIPDDGQLVNVETKADQFRDRALTLLDPYVIGVDI